MQLKTGVFEAGFCKNTVYRFLNSTKTNWLRFTTLLSASIINGFMKPLISDERKDVFIIDDSLFDRSCSGKTELLAKVFDHCSMKYKRGYRMLTLDWSDGNSFIPVNYCQLSIEVTVGEDAIPAKIVCMRNKSKKKDWLVIISTDTGLSKEEIIRIYGKRRDIEVCFKSCKSYLHLVKECRSLSYDALTNSPCVDVFTRYR